MKRKAQVTIAPDAVTGRLVATIYTPSNATLGDMNELQAKLFGDVLMKNGKKLGLKACDGCRSGLDKIVFADELIQPAMKGLNAKIGY
ncbi:MAG: hypothetical protein SFV18_21980 [Bryobacteraceae bacterium]|nr:hypothetical protein [Bryobacteraceae bacterium]